MTETAPFRINPSGTFSRTKVMVDAIVGEKRGYAFRGHCVPSAKTVEGDAKPDVTQALETGLERVCQGIDGNTTHAEAREIALLREFKRRAHHYLPDVPRDEDWFEWLALMQHHRAPTRLLDWTYSLHVAAHFALSHASRKDGADLAIWMVNTEWCLNAAKEVCGKSIAALGTRPITRASEKMASKELFRAHLPPCVWPINPFRLNERLTVQKGLFLAGADVRRSFADNLKALPGHEDENNVMCFVIAREESRILERELHDANVTDTTLFPGLDGFSKSLWAAARYLDLRLTAADL